MKRSDKNQRADDRESTSEALGSSRTAFSFPVHMLGDSSLSAALTGR